jgi:hypothetical protein
LDAIAGQARSHESLPTKSGAVSVGAGLPAKRPEQTTQKKNSNLAFAFAFAFGFGFGESVAIRCS